jgi:hypothetical protein
MCARSCLWTTLISLLFSLRYLRLFVSVHQLNGVDRHQVSRLKRGTVLVNFVGFGNRFLFILSLSLQGKLCIGRCSAVQAANGCISSRRMYESRRMHRSRNHRCYAKLSVAFHPVSPKGTLVTWLGRSPRSCGHTWFPLFLH